MSTSKITVRLENMKFELPSDSLRNPSDSLRKTEWGGKPLETPYIYLRAKHVASVVKQFVQAKYPTVVVAATSHVYSGGDSADVYVSDERGNPIEDSIVKDINRFARSFQEGNFNGMIDMYEYNDTDLVSDNGTKISGGAKYVFVNNRPKFGSVADVVRMLNDYQAGKYFGGVRDLVGSIKEVMRYGITQSTVDKALKLI
jgi:hypothetical protein